MSFLTDCEKSKLSKLLIHQPYLMNFLTPEQQDEIINYRPDLLTNNYSIGVLYKNLSKTQCKLMLKSGCVRYFKYMDDFDLQDWLEVISHSPSNVYYIPPNILTPQLQLECINRDPFSIRFFNDQVEISDDLLIKAIECEPYSIEFMKNPTYEMWLLAVTKDPNLIDIVPDQYKTYELCLTCLPPSEINTLYYIECIPAHYKTLEFNLKLLENPSNAKYIDNWTPELITYCKLMNINLDIKIILSEIEDS